MQSHRRKVLMAWRKTILWVLMWTLSIENALAQTENLDLRMGTEGEVARSEQEFAGRLVELRKA